MEAFMVKRAGILLPLFSVAGNQGIGDLGQKTNMMVDAITNAGYQIWSMLPLSPNYEDNSPYAAVSMYAGDPIYINIDRLAEMGLLTQSSVINCNKFKDYVDYDTVRAFKEPYFQRAFKQFRKKYAQFKPGFEAFKREAFWLNTWTAYELFRENYNGAGWSEWEDEYRNWPEKQEINLRDQVEKVFYIQFLQYIFYLQFQQVVDYAHKKGLKLMQDVPYLPDLDTADVWGAKKNFQLGPDGNPTWYAGSQPDAVFKEGQVWKRPVYDPDYLARTDSRILCDRFKWYAKFFDIIRIVHFKGFDACWKIPAGKTAREGRIELGPGKELLEKILADNPGLEIIAEDLGQARPSLTELETSLGIPGMHILQQHMETKMLKHPVEPGKVVYTSCYDTRTCEEDYATYTNNKRIALRRFFKKRGYDHRAFHELVCHFALDSSADLVLLNMADILGLKGQAHLAHLLEEQEGVSNWTWKIKDFKSFPDYLNKTTEWLATSGRLAPETNGEQA